MSIYDRKQPSLLGAGQLLVLIWLCSLGISCPAAREETSDSKLVDLVISALDANYSAIESASLTMRETVRDRTVRDSEKMVTQLPDGRTLTVHRLPHNVTTLNLTLRGKDIRCERREQVSSDGKILELYGLHNGFWTQYVPSTTTAWIRFTDELPPIFPLDPREFGSSDIRRPLKHILREDKLVSAQVLRRDNTKVVQVVASTFGGETTTYLFSAKDRFLPTQYYTKWDDGSVLQHVEIGYESVLDGSVLFPAWIRRRFYAKGNTASPGTTGWREETLREVVGDIKFNIHIDDDDLAIALPTGTRVVDVTRSRVRRVKETMGKGGTLAIWANVVAIVVLFGFIVNRLYRSNRQLTIT